MACGINFQHRLGPNTWKAALQKGPEGPGGHQVDHESANVPSWQRRQTALGLDLSEQWQLVWGGDPSTPLCTAEATPAVLRAVTGSSTQDRHGLTGASAVSAHGDDEGPGAPA